MKRQPILNVRLLANQQGFKAVQPRVGVLNNSTRFIKLFVKIDSLRCRRNGRTGVASNVVLNLPLLTSVPQVLGIKPAVGIEKQAFEVDLDRLQQDAQFLEEFLDLEKVMRDGPCHDSPLVG